MVRLAAPSDGRLAGGGGIVGVLDVLMSSTGESVKLPSKLGVEAQEMPLLVTLPKRKGGRDVSAENGLCGMGALEWYCARRVNEGLVTGRLRLDDVSISVDLVYSARSYSGSARYIGACCCNTGKDSIDSGGESRSAETMPSLSGVSSGEGEGSVTEAMKYGAL